MRGGTPVCIINRPKLQPSNSLLMALNGLCIAKKLTGLRLATWSRLPTELRTIRGPSPRLLTEFLKPVLSLLYLFAIA